MTRLIPRLLGNEQLPVAELRAARLDGHVYAVDGVFAAVDEPDSSWLRASALARELPARAIAERSTALWIHGVRARAPQRHQICVDIRHRIAPPCSVCFEIRECVLGAEDVVGLGPVRVTSPLRTAVDLLRTLASFGPSEADDVRAILCVARAKADDCADHIRASPRAPGTKRALERLRLVETGDPGGVSPR